jgi:hypothetical protein
MITDLDEEMIHQSAGRLSDLIMLLRTKRAEKVAAMRRVNTGSRAARYLRNRR